MVIEDRENQGVKRKKQKRGKFGDDKFFLE